MNFKSKLAVASLSLPFLAVAQCYSMRDDCPPDCPPGLASEKLKKIDAKNTPEFEPKKLYADENLSFPLGDYFVCRGEAMWLNHEVELGETAKRLSELTYSNLEPFFTCEDIVKYLWYGGSLEYAKEMASYRDSFQHHRFYGAQLPQFFALGLTAEEILYFKDTEKPNALVVYPAYDINGSGYEGAFRTPEALKLFKHIRERYDVKIVVASLEEEVYEALTSGPKFDFGMFSGHGSPFDLRLGMTCPPISDPATGMTKKAVELESLIIDTGDFELNSLFDNFNEDAVIFLNSCSTAEGGDDLSNLANHVALFAWGRKVIASKAPFSASDVKIDPEKIYPFDLRIVVGKVDETYVAKVEAMEIFSDSMTISSGK